MSLDSAGSDTASATGPPEEAVLEVRNLAKFYAAGRSLFGLGGGKGNDSTLRLASLDAELRERARIDVTTLPAGRGVGVPRFGTADSCSNSRATSVTSSTVRCERLLRKPSSSRRSHTELMRRGMPPLAL